MMNGLIALVGAGEYLPVMEDVDRYLLDSLEAKTPRVVCLPTAAGKEGDETVSRWSRMGENHFRSLGADVTSLPIIDRESANDPIYETTLEGADLIYFSGGNPVYLFETMKDSLAWKAMQKAWNRGAGYAGCSAGAMILGRRIPSFRFAQTIEGFAMAPATFVLPHFDATPTVFKPLIFALKRQLKNSERMIGVDENTAMVGSLSGEWKSMGQGKVHVITRQETRSFGNGETVTLQ